MKNSTQLKHSCGFTLVELSIVLVIIGLLVGGVLQGRELIDAAKRNSVIADITKYQTAINTFKLQYNGALPGDFDEATDYWGAVSGSCLTVAGTGTQTCNGDGDGAIDYVASSSADATHESWRAWEHLSNSEIISGNYTGISITSCSEDNHCTDPGKNAPESAYSGASWHMFEGGFGARHIDTEGLLALGNPNNPNSLNMTGAWFGSSLTTQQQKSIDDKIDDGMPNQGRVRDTVSSLTPDCAGNGVNDKYLLTNSGVECVLLVDWK